MPGGIVDGAEVFVGTLFVTVFNSLEPTPTPVTPAAPVGALPYDGAEL